MLHKILANPFPDEQPVLLLRRHWFLLLQRVLGSALALLAPFFILGVMGAAGIRLDIGLGDPFFAIITVGILMFCGIILLTLFTTWLDHVLDIWLVTNYRIISVEQHGLFSRTLSEHRLDRIQDVTSEVHGLLQTLINYGDVHIQTAGEQKRFILKKVPNPAHAARRIIELQNLALRKNLTDLQGMAAAAAGSVQPVAQPQPQAVSTPQQTQPGTPASPQASPAVTPSQPTPTSPQPPPQNPA